MDEEKLIIESVKDFVGFCDRLLEEGKISEAEYHNYTWFKKEFLSRWATSESDSI